MSRKEQTTVAEILERAGVAPVARYCYFPGRNAEIFRAVFDMINDAFYERRDAQLELPSPLARLRAGLPRWGWLFVPGIVLSRA